MQWERYAVVFVAALGLAVFALAQQAAEGGFTLTGKVLSVSGRPVVGAQVRLRSDLNGTPLTAMTDISGRYGFSGLRTTQYTLDAEHLGLIARSRLVQLAPAKSLRVDLVLVPPFQFEDMAPRAGLTFVLHMVRRGASISPRSCRVAWRPSTSIMTAVSTSSSRMAQPCLR